MRRSPSALTEGDAGADGRSAHLLLVLDGNAAMPLCVRAVSDFIPDEKLGRERGENKTLCVVPTRPLGGGGGGPSIVRAKPGAGFETSVLVSRLLQLLHTSSKTGFILKNYRIESEIRRGKEKDCAQRSLGWM